MKWFSQFVRKLAADERATNSSRTAYASRRLAGKAFEALMSAAGMSTVGPAGVAAGPGVGMVAGAANTVKVGRAFNKPVPALPSNESFGLPAAIVGDKEAELLAR